MNNTVSEQALSDLFPEFKEDESLINEIVEFSSLRRFVKGDVIIDYGEDIKFVPLVLSGLIKILREAEHGREILLYFLNPGSSCASSFSCCMTKKRSEIKAVSEEESTVLLIPISYTYKWMSQFESWRNFIFNMYDHRLFDLIDTVDRIAFSNLDEKLLYYLEDLSTLKSTKTIQVSHLQIANDLNASRESISRLLKKLESKKIVKLNRNEITILSK